MRWKLLAAAIITVGLVVLGGAGWYQWQLIQRQKQRNNDIARARNYLQLEQHEKAQETLTRVMKEYPELTEDESITILVSLAKSYEETGQKQEALDIWQRIFEEHPTSTHIPQALVKLGEAAYDNKEDAKARKYFEMLVNKYPQAESLLDDAEFGIVKLDHISKGRMATRDSLRKLLEKYPNSDRRDEIEKTLATINMDLLFSPSSDESGDVTVYTIKSGDTLSSIGKRYDISPELLMTINRIKNPRNLPIGKRLFIPSVDFSIEVNKSNNTMVLYNKGKFFKRYPVRTGKTEMLTPADTFRIQNKVKDPPWNKPSGATYAAGDPENALGTRWMAFDASGGLGIHGTNKPETIGTYASEGCVGMYNEDVEELFDLVPLGTPIEIKGKKQEDGKTERL